MNTGMKATLIVLALAAVGGFILLGRTSGRGAPAPAQPTGIHVFAPCGMTDPIGAAAQQFRRQHPEIPLEISYDNAVILVRRVREGARPDVFISPGELEMRQLTDEGYLDRGSVRDFGTYELVLIVPRTVTSVHTLDDLRGESVRHIALADPANNSVGEYAQAALKSLGLWDSLKPKLLLRYRALEAITLVTSGKVEAGLAYNTCPLESAPEKADKANVRLIATLPQASYPRVRCQVGVLASSKVKRQALVFSDFLRSAQAQALLASKGLPNMPAAERSRSARR